MSSPLPTPQKTGVGCDVTGALSNSTRVLQELKLLLTRASKALLSISSSSSTLGKTISRKHRVPQQKHERNTKCMGSSGSAAQLSPPNHSSAVGFKCVNPLNSRPRAHTRCALSPVLRMPRWLDPQEALHAHLVWRTPSLVGMPTTSTPSYEVPRTNQRTNLTKPNLGSQ